MQWISRSSTYEEIKDRLKSVYKGKWIKQHPKTKSDDEYYKLFRQRHHLYQMLKIGPTDLCDCSKEQQAHHVLHRVADCTAHSGKGSGETPAPAREAP